MSGVLSWARKTLIEPCVQWFKAMSKVTKLRLIMIVLIFIIAFINIFVGYYVGHPLSDVVETSLKEKFQFGMKMVKHMGVWAEYWIYSFAMSSLLIACLFYIFSYIWEIPFKSFKDRREFECASYGYLFISLIITFVNLVIIIFSADKSISIVGEQWNEEWFYKYSLNYEYLYSCCGFYNNESYNICGCDWNISNNCADGCYNSYVITHSQMNKKILLAIIVNFATIVVLFLLGVLNYIPNNSNTVEKIVLIAQIISFGCLVVTAIYFFAKFTLGLSGNTPNKMAKNWWGLLIGRWEYYVHIVIFSITTTSKVIRYTYKFCKMINFIKIEKEGDDDNVKVMKNFCIEVTACILCFLLDIIDVFILFSCVKPTIDYIGKVWYNDKQRKYSLFFEQKFNCCGFRNADNQTDCGCGTETNSFCINGCYNLLKNNVKTIPLMIACPVIVDVLCQFLSVIIFLHKISDGNNDDNNDDKNDIPNSLDNEAADPNKGCQTECKDDNNDDKSNIPNSLDIESADQNKGCQTECKDINSQIELIQV